MKKILQIIKTNYIKYLFIVGILLLTIGAGSYGYDYMRVKGLMAEGKQLSLIGKYKDAISKLSIAESKWSPETVKIEITTEISKNKELAESSDNFEQGKIQYDGENYEKAIEYFDKVIINDDNYKTAQAYKEIAEEKIVKLNNSSKKEIISRIAQTEYPDTPVYPTVNQVQRAESDNNKDSICKNTASLGRIQFEERTMNYAIETMPEFFSFEEAKKKYAGHPDLMEQWAKFSKDHVDMMYSGIKNEGEKLYYQLYNECLIKT